jgi:hypothetical protein
MSIFNLFKGNNDRKPNVNELEFRNKEGVYLFSIKGDMAEWAYPKLANLPELRKEVLKLKDKGEHLVLMTLKDCGYTISKGVCFVLKKGDYIKIIN